MDQTKETIGILNDLVRINHDRVAGYDKAAKELKDTDTDLKTIFNKYSGESRTYAYELADKVKLLGGEVAKDTTQSGKIYRAWMDVKATFAGHDRHAVLASCEFGEDAAQKAYNTALASDGELSTDARQLIVKQQASLKAAHDEVKKLRDITK